MEPEKKDTPAAPTADEHQIKSLRTYQGDIADALTKNNGSISSVILAEQKKKKKTLGQPEHPRGEIRNMSFLFIGIILALAGVIGVAIVYLYVTGINKVVVVQKPTTLINYSEQDNVPASIATRAQLVATIAKENDGFKMPVNSVLYINTAEASGTPEDIQTLLPLLAPKIPDSLVRAIDPEYMFGVYSNDINAPFIILTTSDYATSYAGMLKWEATMPYDLGDMFNITNSLATTTVFTDEALNNYDLRIVQNATGKTILLYSFLDKNTLLITTNENVLNGIVSKFLIAKTMREEPVHNLMPR